MFRKRQVSSLPIVVFFIVAWTASVHADDYDDAEATLRLSGNEALIQQVLGMRAITGRVNGINAIAMELADAHDRGRSLRPKRKPGEVKKEASGVYNAVNYASNATGAFIIWNKALADELKARIAQKKAGRFGGQFESGIEELGRSQTLAERIKETLDERLKRLADEITELGAEKPDIPFDPFKPWDEEKGAYVEDFAVFAEKVIQWDEEEDDKEFALHFGRTLRQQKTNARLNEGVRIKQADLKKATARKLQEYDSLLSCEFELVKWQGDFASELQSLFKNQGEQIESWEHRDLFAVAGCELGDRAKNRGEMLRTTGRAIVDRTREIRAIDAETVEGKIASVMGYNTLNKLTGSAVSSGKLLSSGIRQRVRISKTWTEPEFLILDEWELEEGGDHVLPPIHELALPDSTRELMEKLVGADFVPAEYKARLQQKMEQYNKIEEALLSGKGSPTIRVEHMKVYDVEQLSGTPKGSLEFKGQFDEKWRPAKLGALYGLATPVNKNGEGVTKSQAHFSFFLLERPEPEPVRTVTAWDQFGCHTLEVKDAYAIAFPSEKVEDGSSMPEGLDHYKIYEVARSVRINQYVTLIDQFCEEPALTGAPKYFAVPVAKRHARKEFAIQSERDHIVFYRVGNLTDIKTKRELRNQMGSFEVRVRRGALLGVPCEKLYESKKLVK